MRFINLIFFVLIFSTIETFKYNKQWEMLGNVNIIQSGNDKNTFEFKKLNERNNINNFIPIIRSAVINTFNLESNEEIIIIFDFQFNAKIKQEFEFILSLNSKNKNIKEKDKTKLTDADIILNLLNLQIIYLEMKIISKKYLFNLQN